MKKLAFLLCGLFLFIFSPRQPSEARQNLSALPPELQSAVESKRKTCNQAAKEAGMDEFLICGETQPVAQPKEKVEISFLGIALGKKLPQSIKDTDKERRGMASTGVWWIKPPQSVDFGSSYVVETNSDDIVRSVQVNGKIYRNIAYTPQSECKVEYGAIRNSLLKTYGKPANSIDLESSTPLSRDRRKILILSDSWKVKADISVSLMLLRLGRSQDCYTSLGYSTSL